MSATKLLQCFFLSFLLSIAAEATSATAHLGQPPSPGRRNGLGYRMTRRRGKREKLAREFLEAHNKARGSVGQPPLGWDRRLAWFAGQWTKSRRSDCQMVHSGGPYGENLFWSQRDHWTPARVVGHWVAEKKNYQPNTNTCAEGKMCGHYTQVVWRGTTNVGCARVKCDNNMGYLVACEYTPRGNYEGETPFD